MYQEARDLLMADTTSNRRTGRSKSSSLLFVPRASVIRHTEEFKLHNTSSKLFLLESNYRMSSPSRAYNTKDEQHNKHTKKEEKDSGIDESFDDDEEKNSDESVTSGYYDSDQSLSMEMSSGEEKVDLFTTDVSRSPSSLKYINNQNSKPIDKLYPRYTNYNVPNEQDVTEYDSSMRPLLKDPRLAYLLQLYQHTDHGLSKDTLLKLIRNSSLTGNAKKKAKTYLKDDENKTNLRNSSSSVIDFSIISLNDNKIPSENKYNTGLSEDVRLNNPLYVMSRDMMYGFDNSNSLSSERNPSIDTNNTASVRTAHAYNQSRNNTQMKTSYDNNMQCEYCHKKFNNEEAAKRHLLTHKGKRTHKCTHCSRSFYEQASYLRHLKSHSGEKAHKCEQCSMAFSKRSALEVHIRTHTGERPFVCKYCGKGFSISGNLHRHVLIHTGHRPYKCGKCPRAFNNPSHLARHISSFHA